MHSLEIIIRLNSPASLAARTAETETSRHCSFNETAKGLILHSAKHRSTAFLSGRRKSAFFSSLSRMGLMHVNGIAVGCQKLDQLIESYFA